jgi:threonine/homoserine/homoserine lactone efflux protein
MASYYYRFKQEEYSMPDMTTLSLFMLAAAVLVITPGPAVFYIVARSIDQGRMAGLVSTVGINVGTLFHIAAAAYGVSALLVTSAVAFSMVKYLGAAYLICLGVRQFLSPPEASRPEFSTPRTLGRIFLEGILVNLLNPKTAIFFFAFLPQFVDASRGSVGLQALLLGTILVTMGVLTSGAYALLGGALGNWLRERSVFLLVQRYFAGTVYVGLGLATAFSGYSRNE